MNTGMWYVIMHEEPATMISLYQPFQPQQKGVSPTMFFFALEERGFGGTLGKAGGFDKSSVANPGIEVW